MAPFPLDAPAENLLIELGRQHPSPERVARLLRSGPGIVEELDALAGRHGVQGLVWSRLDELDDGSEVWAEVRPQIDALLPFLRRRAAFWDVEQDRVLQGLRGVGVDPVVLKGGALRRGIFAPVERAMGDLDILVARDEIAAALEALSGLGYGSEYPERARAEFRRHHHHERVAHPRGFLVEVHWGLTRPGDEIQLDPDHFRARSVHLHPGDAPALRVPALEDSLIHTVSQCELEAVRKLRRIVDLDRIVRARALDWADVRDHADRVGLAGFLAVTLRLAHHLLDTPVPADLLAGRGLSPRARRALDALHPIRRLFAQWGVGDVVEFHLFRLWCADPGHRRRWLKACLSGREDPLRWVWEDDDEPGATAPEGTAGPRFLLKLATLQTILSARRSASRIRPDRDRKSDFWSVPRQAPQRGSGE